MFILLLFWPLVSQPALLYRFLRHFAMKKRMVYQPNGLQRMQKSEEKIPACSRPGS